MEIDYSEIVQRIQQARTTGQDPAFLFDRISHMRQDDGISLEYQGESGMKYAEKKNLFVVFAFSLVESAYKENRKYFNKILDLAEKFEIKHLIFKNPDRLSRNISHTARYKKLIEEKGVSFHFYELGQVVNRESSYDETWMFFFFILMAQRHSLKLSHDVKEVYRHQAKKGIPQQRPPFGYIWSREHRMPIIDVASESTIRYIFDQYDNGTVSIHELAKKLNNEGIRPSKGAQWRPGQLHALLTNPYYAGTFILHGEKYRGAYQAYISDERYEKRMARIRVNIGRMSSQDFPFSRLIRCRECDGVLYGEIKKGKYVYYTHQCLKSEKRDYSSENQIISILDETIQGINYDGSLWESLKVMFAEVVGLKMKTSGSEIQSINAQIASIEIKEQRILDLYANEGIDASLLKQRLDEYQKQKTRLAHEKRKFDLDKVKFIGKVADMIDTVKGLPGIWKSSGPAKKGEILKFIAEKVIISGDSAEIVWKEPFNYLLKQELLHQFDEAVRVKAFKLPQTDATRTIISEIVDRIMVFVAA